MSFLWLAAKATGVSYCRQVVLCPVRLLKYVLRGVAIYTGRDINIAAEHGRYLRDRTFSASEWSPCGTPVRFGMSTLPIDYDLLHGALLDAGSSIRSYEEFAQEVIHLRKNLVAGGKTLKRLGLRVLHYNSFNNTADWQAGQVTPYIVHAARRVMALEEAKTVPLLESWVR